MTDIKKIPLEEFAEQETSIVNKRGFVAYIRTFDSEYAISQDSIHPVFAKKAVSDYLEKVQNKSDALKERQKHFSDELPAEPGYYFFKGLFSEKDIVRVFISSSEYLGGQFFGGFLGVHNGRHVSNYKGQWAGPIQFPEDNKDSDEY